MFEHALELDLGTPRYQHVEVSLTCPRGDYRELRGRAAAQLRFAGVRDDEVQRYLEATRGLTFDEQRTVSAAWVTLTP